MLSFEEAGVMLDEAADALPREIFEGLNGGINLLPARRTDGSGLLVMGMYIVDSTGRRVEIYYGSFRERLYNAPPEKWRRELTRTLKHELTHHLENRAGDRSLERWDEQHKALLLSGLWDEPLCAESVLFVDDDGAGLAPMARSFFAVAAESCHLEVESDFAGLSENAPASVNPKAAKAAMLYGVDISRIRPKTATGAMCDDFDLILCMTQSQGDELARRYPALDERILCLGEEDLLPPRAGTQFGWNKLADRLVRETGYLVDELMNNEDD